LSYEIRNVSSGMFAYTAADPTQRPSTVSKQSAFRPSRIPRPDCVGIHGFTFDRRMRDRSISAYSPEEVVG
jgi:hypothetical protein